MFLSMNHRDPLATSLFAVACGCFLVGIWFPHITEAQIPRVCVANVTSYEKRCCPRAIQNGEVCGGELRGECATISVFKEPVDPVFEIDDRLEWPRRFFHHLCHCKGNFFGVACEECKFGWTGPDCSVRKIYTRRNIWSFSPREIEMLQQILLRSDQIESEYMLLVEKDVFHSDPLRDPVFINTTMHKYIVAMHRYASRATLFDDQSQCKTEGYLDYNHGVTMFAIWHRGYILIWERFLRRIAEREFGWMDFAIPYWDWIDATECEVCTNELMGAPGEFTSTGRRLLSKDSVFRNWTEYCQPPPDAPVKCVGCHFVTNFQPLNRHYRATAFPTTPELVYVMEKKSFFVPNEGTNECLSFHKSMEGFCGPQIDTSSYLWMHNKVHNMVTGSFCCAATAANDPIFPLHHSQVDRIFQAWFTYQKPDPETSLPTKGVLPGQFRDSNLISFLPLMRNRDLFIDMRELGVDYDSYAFGKSRVTFVR